MFGLFKRRNANPLNFQESAAVNAWLKENDFDPDGVSFSVVKDQNVLRLDSDLMVVGMGKQSGETQGFYIEIATARVVNANSIHPGAASYWKSLARDAAMKGDLLSMRLAEQSLRMTAGV